MIWPLKLTVIERLLIAEDRPSYPWMIFFRLRFVGRIDEAAARAATLAVLPRHPLTTAVIHKGSFGRAAWRPVPDAVPEFVSEVRDSGDDLPASSYLDLTREIGLRMRFVQVGDDKSEVVFQMHHAVADGLGAMSLMYDWLLAYARETGVLPSTVEFPRIDIQRLRQRGTFGLTFWKFMSMLRRQLVGLRGVSDFLKNKPRPLLPCRPRPDDAAHPTPYPAVLFHYLTAEQTSQLAQAGKRQSVTVNDLLIRDLLVGIRRWQEHFGFYNPQHCLRLMVPMSLRGRGDEEMPATNIVSSIFVDRYGPDCDDPARLLQSVNDQMQIIKTNGLGLTFILSLHCQNRLPGGIPKVVRGETCSSSTILTNLGPLFRTTAFPKDDAGRLQIGELLLEHVDVVAPLRPNLCASFAVATYARQLGIAMHYDAEAITSEQARELLAAFVTQLQSTASGGA